jgi:flagellar basal-body rod modification protein FlgD
MAVDPINNAASTAKTNQVTGETTAKKNSDLSTESFFKLLAAQLQNQDMSNPMDNSEMMTQMTQIAMMQAMQNFSTAMDDSAKVNTINYGTSMMGKKVAIAYTDKDGNLVNKQGIVDRVDIYNGAPKLYLSGDSTNSYAVSSIMSVYDTTSTAMDDFSKINTINYGTSMVGKKVMVNGKDANGIAVKKEGTVSKIEIHDGVPKLYLEGDTTNSYAVSDIVTVYDMNTDTETTDNNAKD